MKYDGMCCSCFLCVSAVCFFLKIPLCFLPLTPPPPWCAPFYHGTVLEINFFFLAYFLPYPYCQHSSQGRKIFFWVAWWHPAFFISGILPLTVNNSPMKGGLFRVTEPQNCYAGYPCFLNTFLRILQKLYAGILHCYSPKAQF